MRNSYLATDLRYHPAYEDMLGPEPPMAFASNGASFAPDVILGWDIRPAAHYHDYHYSRLCDLYKKRDEWVRYISDWRFLQNMRKCGLPWPFAWIYYARVRLWGHFFFTYSHGSKPRRTLKFWIKLLTGRYAQW